MRVRIPCTLLVGLFSLPGTCRAGAPASPAPRPLSRAHAHNDYHHRRPLLDALECGFASVEADVYLVDGALLVGHDRSELRPDRTLERLYLDPLRARVRAGGGRVFPDGPVFTLLVDIKSDGEATYAALRRVLASYADILTTVRHGRAKPGAVTVVVSGNRPVETMAKEALRYAGIDGRLADPDGVAPAHLVPLLSERWASHFAWRGTGPMPDEERRKLRAIVRRAHRHGRRVRFWGTPERPALWEELLAACVDLINTDDLEGLGRFLLPRRPRIALPPPRHRGPLSVEEALLRRHSTRRFAPQDPSPEELGQILWAARGVNRPAEGKTTSPSAFEVYAVSVFVVRRDGAYRYIPGLHILDPVGAGGDLRGRLVTQPSFAAAPVLLFLVADLSLFPEGVKAERRAPWAHGECGTIGQNVYLQAEALGLATVFAAAVRWNEAKEALRLGPDEMPYYVMPAGRPEEEAR